MARRLFFVFALWAGLAGQAWAAADVVGAVDAYWRGDYQTALDDFDKLGNQGHTVAQVYIAVMLELGQGTSHLPSLAEEWRERAARFRPGDYRRLLTYVERTKRRAAPSFPSRARGRADRQADRARANRRRAQAALERDSNEAPDTDIERGHRNYLGLGVPQDYVEAARWYYRAARRGVPQAQGYLGIMQIWGHGVPADVVDAHMWLSLAIKGTSDAKQRRIFTIVRKQLTGIMVPKDLELAKEKAAAFKPETE